jgi:hypothetical protein
VTRTGQLDRSVTFSQPGLDANGERLGDLAEVCTRDARVQPLKGGEAVQAQRLAGQQPVIITVRCDSLTRTIDNSFEASDAREAAIAWDIQSTILTEDRVWVEILAVQRRGQPVD